MFITLQHRNKNKFNTIYTAMKKITLLLLGLIMITNASAYDFMVDGLCYNYNEDGNSVMLTYDTSSEWGTHYANLTGSLDISGTVSYNGATYSVTSIDDYAFWGCLGLTSVNIPNSVTSIGDGAFYGCGNLTSVNIPNSVISIGGNAFYGCSSLTSVIIPNSVTSISAGAFNECTSLTSIIIPNLVTEIGHFAFEGCSGLTSITIPNSVTEIGGGAFGSCTGLTSVTIPSSVKKISNFTFYYCSGLTEITIPNAVTEIGERAFEGCSGLTSVNIPNLVTSIGNDAFYGCTKMRSIYSKIEEPENVSYGSDIFGGISKNYCKLYVPAGTVDDYQFTAPWNEFLNIIEEGSGSTTTPVHGDVNGDGVVTGADVTEIYNILLGN